VQSSVVGFSTYQIIVKNLVTYQEVKRDFHLAWFADFQSIVVDKLPSNDTLTYYEAKEHILNLYSNHCTLSRASSKNSNTQHEANTVSSLKGKNDEEQKQRVLILLQFRLQGV
jgi:hypothetical protein